MLKQVSFSLVALAICTSPNNAFGDFSSAGATFLIINPGARAVGMGEAFCGLADDALATYYNPAGLAFQRTVELSLNWPQDFERQRDVSFGIRCVEVALGSGIGVAATTTLFKINSPNYRQGCIVRTDVGKALFNLVLGGVGSSVLGIMVVAKICHHDGSIEKMILGSVLGLALGGIVSVWAVDKTPYWVYMAPLFVTPALGASIGYHF